MTAWTRRAGRWASALGLVAFAAYLVWRVTSSLDGSPWWLSLPALAVELTGFVATLTLVAALWPASGARPLPTALPTPPVISTRHGDIDVVVRVDRQSLDEVRTTLVAVAAAEPDRAISVVDIGGRPDVARLAREFGTVYTATDPTDRSGLMAASTVRAEVAFLLLDAGDVPAIGTIDRLAGGLDDPSVAIIQARVTSMTRDSAEHGPNGTHELAFDRDALNPALGRRGAGVLTGSGALVRRAALSTLDPAHWLSHDDSQAHVQWTASARLVEAGWKVIVDDGPTLVAVRSIRRVDELVDQRTAEAQAARQLLVGPHGVLRFNRLGLRHRIGYIAWTLRPLSGLRRTAFVAVLLASLLTGRLPFHADRTVVLALWLPAFVLVPLGLGLLSDWTLRPGDRLRTSLRTVGSSLHGVVGRPAPSDARGPSSEAGRRAGGPLQRSAALVSIAIAINVAIVLRGVSDRWTSTLGPLDPAARAGLLAVALWVLAGCLDALRLLLRRTQQRRAVRVASSMAGSLSGRAVFMTDLTMLGAGVVADQPPDLGATMQLEAIVPTRSGVTTVSAPSIVRNVSRDVSGGWRVGLEFAGLDDIGADALAELCVIEPARATLGGRQIEPVDRGITIDDLVPVPMLSGQRRLVLRATTLLAVASVVASAGPGSAQAAAIPVHRITGVVASIGEPADPSTGTVVDPSTGSLVDPTTTSLVESTTTDAPSSSDPSTDVVDTPRSGAGTSSTGEPPVPTGVAGATVVGVCSDDPGPDGVYGTSDDRYTSPISTTTGADGTYALDLDGRACWVSLAPPAGYEAPDATLGPRIVDASTASASAGRIDLRAAAPRTPANGGPGSVDPTGSVVARIWNDDDGDGALDDGEAVATGVTVTLYDGAGATSATTATDAAGVATFAGLARGSYSVGISNLPVGSALADATSVTGHTEPVEVDGAAVEVRTAVHRVVGVPTPAAGRPTTLLPAPSAAQVAAPRRGDADRLGPIVIALAAVIGASVVLGAARPNRRIAPARPPA